MWAQAIMRLILLSDSQVRNHSIDDLKRFVRYKIGGYGVAINNIPRGHPLFRGVVCEDRPSTISRISYPPPDRVAKLGRVNRPGIPMFYCSVAAPSVFFELRAKAGDRVALSEWKVTESLWMHHVGYHQDALRRIGAADYPQRRRLIHPIANETKENGRLRRLLSLAFTEDVHDSEEYKYKKSIAIHELLFDGASPLPFYADGPPSSRAAGIAYPALQMRGAADNLALWPEFVDTSLKIQSVRYVLVEAADQSRSSYTFLTLAISREFVDGRIIWQENIGAERDRRSHITFENDEWILRDGRGRIYDRH